MSPICRRFLIGFPIISLIFTLSCGKTNETLPSGGPTIKLPQGEFAQAQRVAEIGLQQLREISGQDSENPVRMTSKELQNLRLGEKLPVKYVSLKKLREYKEGMPVAELLVDAKQLFFLVRSDSLVKGCVLIEQDVVGGEVIGDSSWRTASLGRPELSKAVGEAVQAAKQPPTELRGIRSLIEIPGLNKNFVSFMSLGQLMFVPVDDDEEFNLFKGKVEKATQVLGRLAPAAREFGGLPNDNPKD